MAGVGESRANVEDELALRWLDVVEVDVWGEQAGGFSTNARRLGRAVTLGAPAAPCPLAGCSPGPPPPGASLWSCHLDARLWPPTASNLLPSPDLPPARNHFEAGMAILQHGHPCPSHLSPSTSCRRNSPCPLSACPSVSVFVSFADPLCDSLSRAMSRLSFAR